MSKLVYPTRDDVTNCGPWCAPIHKVADAIRGQPWSKWFVIEDFMCMGKVVRRGKPDIILNKHSYTRRYLNIDTDGRTYRYVAPAPSTRGGAGRYVPYPDLVQAVDAVHLHLMPWLSVRLRPAALGLAYEDRWEHPDVIAWEDRQRMRELRHRAG